MTTSLAALQKGHSFPPATFDLSPGWVGAYIEAVEDAAIAGFPGAVPPMAVAALSIRTLLASASLPPGAVHAGQEITVHRAARTGERLAAAARIVSRGERQGWVLMSVDLSVTGAGGEPVMTGRATVTFPAPGQAKRPGWDGA